MKFFGFLILGLFLSGCVSGKCPLTDCESKPCTRGRKVLSSKVFVYKYDGSKQCDKKTGVALSEMAKELSMMKLYSMVKKNDGQMRVQVCGALTGIANVYEIKRKQLIMAEALGFKKWDF